MYRKGNANLTPYGHSWRFALLAFMGWLLRIQFKVGGMPFGAPYDKEMTDRFYVRVNSGAGGSAS